MPADKTVDLDDADLPEIGDGKTVELDDADDSPFDIEAEREHLNTRYPVEDAGGDDDDAEARGQRALRERRQRRQDRQARSGEEADDPEAGEGDDPDDPDDADYGGRAGKRISQLTRRMRTEQRRADNAERAAREIFQRAQQAEARLHEFVGAAIDETVERMESDIKAKKEQLRQAIEDGQTEKQVEISDELAALHGKLSLARLRKPAQAARRPADGGDGEDEGDGRARRTEPRRRTQGMSREERGQTRATRTWLGSNADWFNDPEYAAEKAMAIAIDDQLAKEGFLSDEEHYEELNARLLERVPAMREVLEDADDGGDDDRRGRRRRKAAGNGGNGASRNQPARRMKSPVAPADGGGGRRGGDSKRVTLSQDDLRTMADVWGLDPSNPEHVKTFARERMATAQDFNARGGR